jgi:hypothetical protein
MPARTKTVVLGSDLLPLHALLSAALVAFTIECDNEVELGLAERGYRGMLSLVVWLNAMQYVGTGTASIADIRAHTHTSRPQIEFIAAKLQQWGYLAPVGEPNATARGARGGTPRTSRQTINQRSTFTVTDKGAAVIELWPQVIGIVESRWKRRHGQALTTALKATAKLAAGAGVLMPEGLPSSSGNRIMGDWPEFPTGGLVEPAAARAPVLFARALMAVAIAYEHQSGLPLALTANTLRVIEDGGTPPSHLHLRSGTSPETAASQCTALTKYLRWAEVVNGPAGRKLLRLPAAGKETLAAHAQTVVEVERAVDKDGKVASALRALLGGTHQGDLALRAALTPPAGTRRAGEPWVADSDLPSMKKRDGEIVAQTEAFVANPLEALPHYPIWEATRGFGP